jgi:nicotinamidase-related amidase
MLIPRSERRKALAVIDVQEAFLTARSRSVLPNIVKLIETVPYDSYIEAVFSTERGSLWDRQTRWILPSSRKVQTVAEVNALLSGRRVTRIHKHTKSIFDPAGDLAAALRADRIEELHLVGFDLNDCVLASALDAFDRGFFTYVLEECSGASEGPTLKAHAIAILRHLNLTNNSTVEDFPLTHLGTVPSEKRSCG